jgi:hypothetical protein
MRKWLVLPILMLWLMSSCAGSGSLPPIKAAASPEIEVRTHLPRPTVQLRPADLGNPVALKEALRDLKIQSDAVYEDYVSR